MENTTGFLGRDGFIWAIGVVEDRNDPQKLGRVKVRFLGYHTNKNEKISRGDLPWCQVMASLGSSTSGVGEGHSSLKEGSWIIGFATNPDNLQEWIVMGTLPGMNTHPAVKGRSWGASRGDWVDWDKPRDGIKDGWNFGFFDQTTDIQLNKTPFEPDPTTWRSNKSGSVTPLADIQGTHDNYGSGPMDRVKMYGDDVLYGIIYDTAVEQKLALDKGSAKTLPKSSHTDSLYETYGTTRRLVGPPKDAKRFWSKTGDSDFATNALGGQVVSTGYYAGEDCTYPIISDMFPYGRTPYPRMRYCKKGNIKAKFGPSMYKEIERLYDDGVYGEIKFSDLKSTDSVAIPTHDINRLAKGGIQIENVIVSGGRIQVKTTGTSSSDVMESDDIIMLSGIRGMHELNGREFKVLSLGGTATKGYTFYLGSSDGTVIGGPGSSDVKTYSANNTINPMATAGSLWTYGSAQVFSKYLGGGVVLLDAHYSIRNKALIREKWINIGHGQPVTDGKDATGLGAFKTGETMTHYWSEPVSAYAALYPYNHVYESESGHIMEYDDTPGAERIHQAHRSGTYYEIDESGNKTTKVTGDNHNLVIHDDYLYVKGKVFWTGDDEVMIRANDQMTLGAKWNIRLVSDHNIDVFAKGDLNLRGHNVNIEATENSINMVAANISAVATGYEADDSKDNTDIPHGGTIHLESKAFGDASGVITLKVPDGDPLAKPYGPSYAREDLVIANQVADSNQLGGGLIKLEGGTSINATEIPRYRNDIQARVHFAHWSNAAYQTTNATYAVVMGGSGGGNPVEDKGIGHWGTMGEESLGEFGGGSDFWATEKRAFELGKPQTDPFGGSTSPALNQNAEKVRILTKEGK